MIDYLKNMFKKIRLYKIGNQNPLRGIIFNNHYLSTSHQVLRRALIPDLYQFPDMLRSGITPIPKHTLQTTLCCNRHWRLRYTLPSRAL